MSQQHDKPLLKVQQVKEWLKCSLANIYALVAAGELRCYRVGRGRAGIRFSEEHVQQFLRAREEGGPETTKRAEPLPKPKIKELRYLHLD